MLYKIANEILSVTIDSFGAEIKSVVFKEKERSWQNQSGEWDKTSPVLFPVCGNTSVVISGKDFNMPFHGFAKTSDFVCERISRDEITFLLRDNEQTFAVYPFRFEWKVTYKVENDSIIIENEIINKGTVPMPFAIGRHDSFVLDEPLDNYKLCFPSDEEFLSQQHDASGRLVNLFYDFGSQKELIIPASFLTNGQTIIFGNIKSDHLMIKTLDDRPVIKYSFNKVENLLFWRPNSSQMICIEPWTALPDGADESNVDFLQKKRLIKLNESQSKRIDFIIKYY